MQPVCIVAHNACKHTRKRGENVAYATKMAAALSGATVSQLRHWRSPRTGPLLAPEMAATPRAVYSFQDVLALRTFVRLRENASLQKIRAAIGTLRNIGEVGHLASYRLVADRAGNIQLLTEDQAVNLGKQPGQLQLVAVIGEIIEPFAARAGVLVPHLLRPRPGLAVDPDTQGGIPVIAGTRVPYDAVASLMREGIPAERIAEYYPAVSATAADDALDFARYVDSSSSRCGTCYSAMKSCTSPGCNGRERKTSGSSPMLGTPGFTR
jgi:uncharacterized protein (DUF433 family)/DNA-binding transcriptional MerR regulator